jgi:hypothetical protein
MDMDIAKLVQDFGFPVVMVGGLGYFVYFVWQTITNKIDPAVNQMKTTMNIQMQSLKKILYI